jgi:hypothetical protein
MFPTPHDFIEVRGEVRALGFGGSDAFRDGTLADLDGVYVDGVSLTVGSPRRHLFSFAHGVTNVLALSGPASCPCSGGTPSPSFVGSDYLCEEPTGSADADGTNRRYDNDDVLFDAVGVDDATCVAVAESASSFQRAFIGSGTERLDVRLMHTEGSANEDTALIFCAYGSVDVVVRRS